MKKTQLAIYKILCISFCYFFAVSCNKNDITPNNTAVTNEQPMALTATTAISVPLKLDRETYNSTFKKYAYDATGRCIRIDMNDSYVIYSYRVGTIIETTGFTDPTKAKIVIKTFTFCKSSNKGKFVFV